MVATFVVTYKSVKLLCCIPETTVALCVNYIQIKITMKIKIRE